MLHRSYFTMFWSSAEKYDLTFCHDTWDDIVLNPTRGHKYGWTYTCSLYYRCLTSLEHCYRSRYAIKITITDGVCFQSFNLRSHFQSFVLQIPHKTVIFISYVTLSSTVHTCSLYDAVAWSLLLTHVL